MPFDETCQSSKPTNHFFFLIWAFLSQYPPNSQSCKFTLSIEPRLTAAFVCPQTHQIFLNLNSESTILWELAASSYPQPATALNQEFVPVQQSLGHSSLSFASIINPPWNILTLFINLSTSSATFPYKTLQELVQPVSSIFQHCMFILISNGHVSLHSFFLWSLQCPVIREFQSQTSPKYYRDMMILIYLKCPH